MNSILLFATDVTMLGIVLLGLSLAVAALSQAMHAGFRFVTVDHLPLTAAIPLALIYPLAGPARLVRHLYYEHRLTQDRIARAHSMAAHPAGNRYQAPADVIAAAAGRNAAMAAHPAGKGRTTAGTGVLSLQGAPSARRLRIVKGDANDVA